MCGYRDGAYDLLFIDEFLCSQYPYTKINKITDGGAHDYDSKGGRVYSSKAVPTIILSNYKLEDCYSGVRQKLFPFPIDRRFTEVYVPDGQTIDIKEKETEVVE